MEFHGRAAVKNWLASAGYVASRFIDPQNNLEMNWAPINTGTAGQILNQLTGRTASTQYQGTLGTNTYDGLQARLQGNFSNYQLNFAYAFAKALGYAMTPQVNIPEYYGLNRGPLSTDIRHTFSSTAVLPTAFRQRQALAPERRVIDTRGRLAVQHGGHRALGSAIHCHFFQFFFELTQLRPVCRLQQRAPESRQHLRVVQQVGFCGTPYRAFWDLRNE